VSQIEGYGVAAQSGTDLRLKILGQFALTRAGREMLLPNRKCRALLAYLACEAGTPQSRDRLIDLLWASAPRIRRGKASATPSPSCGRP
jgi:DNA-binding SARP family transcriptional activator